MPCPQVARSLAAGYPTWAWAKEERRAKKKAEKAAKVEDEEVDEDENKMDVDGEESKEKKRKHHLTTATDPLLAELRDLNFSAVGKKLNQVARRLEEDYKVCFLAYR